MQARVAILSESLRVTSREKLSNSSSSPRAPPPPPDGVEEFAWLQLGAASGCRSDLRSALHWMQVHQWQHFQEGRRVNILRHDVGWIFRPKDLVQRHGAIPHLLLAPKVSHIKVTDLSEATSAAYPEGGGGI